MARRPRRAADVGEAAGDRHAHHPDGHADERGDQGQAGREQRPEGDHQHEGSDGDADRLGRALADLLLRRVAAVVDGKTRGRGLVSGLEQLVLVGLGELGRLDVVGDRGDGRAAVGRHRAGLERVARRGHVRETGDLGDRGLDGVACGRGVGERPVGPEHDARGAVVDGRAGALLEQVERLLGLGAGDGERLGRGAGQLLRAESNAAQQRDPDEDDEPATAEREAPDVVEGGGHGGPSER